MKTNEVRKEKDGLPLPEGLPTNINDIDLPPSKKELRSKSIKKIFLTTLLLGSLGFGLYYYTNKEGAINLLKNGQTKITEVFTNLKSTKHEKELEEEPKEPGLFEKISGWFEKEGGADQAKQEETDEGILKKLLNKEGNENTENEASNDNKEEATEKASKIPENSENHKHIVIEENTNILDLINNNFPEIKEKEGLVQITFYDENEDKISLAENNNTFKDLLHLNTTDQAKDILYVEPKFYIEWGNNTNKYNTIIIFQTIRNQEETKDVMKNWESQIIEDLGNFLFIGTDYQNLEPNFKNSSIVKNGRYDTFDSSSINYIVLETKNGYTPIIISNDIETLQKATGHNQK